MHTVWETLASTSIGDTELQGTGPSLRKPQSRTCSWSRSEEPFHSHPSALPQGVEGRGRPQEWRMCGKLQWRGWGGNKDVVIGTREADGGTAPCCRGQRLSPVVIIYIKIPQSCCHRDHLPEFKSWFVSISYFLASN